MTRHNSKHGIRLFQVGHHVKAERPAKKVGRPRRLIVVDRGTLADALSDLDARAVTSRGPAAIGHNTLPATGRCHECDRPISGERRYCGQCLRRRM